MICSVCQKTGHRASSCPRRRLLTVLPLALMLGGCATVGDAMKQAAAVDTFCLQKKRTWSINDTPESIREARVFNETIDRRCGVKKA